MTDFVVVIPARFESTRLPGKPLRLIGGKTMIEWVHEIALNSSAREVWIATDDPRIETAATAFSAKVCMTSSEHRSGTERIAEVCEQRGWSDDLVVINLQGDEPLLPPALIDQCARLLDSAGANMATLASGPVSLAEMTNPNVVKVVVDQHDYALYFSRAPIPYKRELESGATTNEAARRHHGIYAYRPSVLREMVATPPCMLELCEKLEQLRALWLGINIRVGNTSLQPGPGVDTEEDLATVESILNKLERPTT